MIPRLPQIDTIAGTVQRDLTLLAATLRANSPVHRRTKPLLFSDFTDCTAQEMFSESNYPMSLRRVCERIPTVQTRVSALQVHPKPIFVAFFGSDYGNPA